MIVSFLIFAGMTWWLCILFIRVNRTRLDIKKKILFIIFSLVLLNNYVYGMEKAACFKTGASYYRSNHSPLKRLPQNCFCFIKPLFHFIPIHYVPPLINIFGTLIFILQVIGMFPDIENKQRNNIPLT